MPSYTFLFLTNATSNVIVVSLFRDGKCLGRLCLKGESMHGVTEHSLLLLPSPAICSHILLKHSTVFIDPAAFCLTHREGPGWGGGAVYASWFLECDFSTLNSMCLEKSLQIASFDPRPMATTLGRKIHWMLEGVWCDEGMGWGTLGSHSSSDTMVSNGLLMFAGVGYYHYDGL